MSLKQLLPTPENVRLFRNASDAVTYIQKIYDDNRAFLRESWLRFAEGKGKQEKISAHYPYVAITVEREHLGKHPKRLSHGFVSDPGRHIATLTRPHFFERYYTTQIGLLLKHHKVPVEVGVSTCPIPIQFAYMNGLPKEGEISVERHKQINWYFDVPNLYHMGDDANAPHMLEFANGDYSLSLFSAPRVDSSLRRLVHYTGTNPEDFQRFIIFTNYDDYVDDFRKTAFEIMRRTDNPSERAYRKQYVRFVESGGCVYVNENLDHGDTAKPQYCRRSQMPAFHLVREDGSGISLINIGVGPSNAKNITDHVAVLRPDAWIMLGHCAGLSPDLEIGDFILPHAYLRKDNIMDDKVATYIPVPALYEEQRALETAVRQITGRNRRTVKDILRTGTVMTVQDRNWEQDDFVATLEEICASRAIALEMESGTIAANGFRWSVPYTALLINSDMPLHGQIKLPDSANDFYRTQTSRHLHIGMRAMELLRKDPNLHSRKLKPLYGRAFL